MGDDAPPPSSARLLATRLAGLTHEYLAGRVTPAELAPKLRRLADWVERGGQRKEGKKEAKDYSPEIKWLFAYWVKATGRDAGRTKLTAGRKTKLNARLTEGYTRQDIKNAIDVVASSSFHQGDNERGHRYDDLTLICRSGDQLEKYRDMGPRAVADGDQQQESDELTKLREDASDALTRGDMDAYNLANERIAAAKS